MKVTHLYVKYLLLEFAELILILHKQKEQWVTSQPGDRQRDVPVLGQLQVAHVP